MTVPQRHITAGDLTPVTIQTESTYGTGSGTDILYGDVAEGGNFTFKDTANPYLNWRYGSRSFDPSDYVPHFERCREGGILLLCDVVGRVE